MVKIIKIKNDKIYKIGDTVWWFDLSYSNSVFLSAMYSSVRIMNVEELDKE